MFGIEKIDEELNERLDTWRDHFCDRLANLASTMIELKNHIKSVQSTNDKRYNEITKNLDSTNKVALSHEETLESLVKCDTCKCLLYKKDAIKGESRITEKITLAFSTLYNPYGIKEEIETPYYCHRCKGGDEKTGNKKAGRSVVKTNKK